MPPNQPRRHHRPNANSNGKGSAGGAQFFNIASKGKFGVDLFDGRKTPVLKITGCLEWNAFCIANAALFNAINRIGTKSFLIDLSDLSNAYTDGVIPLIAIIRKYKKLGINFKTVLPKNHDLRAIFINHNWAFNLDSSFNKSKRTLSRTTGLVSFDSAENLNDLMRKAMNIAIRAIKFAKGSRESLEWSLSEITDNVIRHSNTECGWFEVTWDAKGNISFTVCDSGIGIPHSMRQAFPEIKSDHEVLAKAIEKGVTSSNEGQGNGLAGTLAIVNAGKGNLQINSLQGHLRYNSEGLKFEAVNIPYPGTYVSFSISDSVEIDLKAVLWGHESYTYAKLDLDIHDDDSIVIKLIEEDQSFGNRATGLKIRNLLTNLLNEFSGRKVTLDFEGVEIVSSSFADELIGKFVAEWGIMNFNRVVGFKNMNNFIDGLINNVVMQRLAQVYSEGKIKTTPIPEGD